MSVQRAANPLVSVRMGELAVGQGNQHLGTLLGSCIGLALFDRRQQVAGLAHIVLPNSRGKQDRPAKYVDTAVPRLIEDLEQLVERPLRLGAKIAGGASMFNTTTSSTIGEENVRTCQALLRELGIPLLAEHCGGTQGRRMTVAADSGKVWIDQADQARIEL